MTVYDFGGLVRITIWVEVWPPAPTISDPAWRNEIALGVAIPASPTDPPPTGQVLSPPVRPTLKYLPNGARTEPNSCFSHSAPFTSPAINPSSVKAAGTSTS